jgi:two-component system nitrogen regulation response regulator GlnG
VPNASEALRLRLQAETRADSGSGPVAGSFLVPGLTVLHHPDVERVGERVVLSGLPAGREEVLSRAEPAFSQPGRNALRPLADPYLSRRPIRLAPGDQPGEVRLLCGESGTAVTADGVPVAGALKISPARLEDGVVLLLANRLVVLLSRLDPAGGDAGPEFGLVGESAPMAALRRDIQRVAGLEVPVLLRGETGTGKELIARALHDAGRRRSRPYLAVNMAAVPPTLAAAELFGAARGAYTGADRKREGYFQRADGGTLFLDEVGETPLEVQALLLRALETGEVLPVGGEDVRRVDVRLVAATDTDLEAAISAGRFRAPLLHRLAGYEIRVPPLRRRRDDFGRLFYHFLRRELENLREAQRLATPPEGRPWIPAALVARLAAYDWPGNVRQLRNAARQIVIAGRDSGESGMWLQAERLIEETAPPRQPDTGPVGVQSAEEGASPPMRLYRDPGEPSEEEILAALRANRWRIQRAAVQLGISRGSLYERIERSSKIRKAVDLSPREIEEAHQRCGGDLDAMAEILEVSRRGLRRRMTQLGLT